jgi:acetamidase/formamidase
MFGCGSSEDKLVRVHDELVDRHAPVGRAASLDEVNQERLHAAFEARHLTRREALRAGSGLAFGVAATGLFADATHASVAAGSRAGATAWSVAAQGREHIIPSIPNQTVNVGFFDATLPPIMTIEPGDVLVYPNTLTHFFNSLQPGVPIEAMDDLRRANRPWGPHSIIGPVDVRGAEPGDVVELRIVRLDPLDFGATFNHSGELGVGALPSEFPQGQVKYFSLDRQTMTTEFAPGIRIPLGPFQGTLGVAQPEPDKMSSVPPGPYAGNLDLREQVEGTRLFVPVFRPGARLFTGDSHAAQGDGEVNLTAIETAMREVRIQVMLHKNVQLAWPFAETPTHWIPLATDRDLNEAFNIALRNTMDFFQRSMGMTRLDAYALASVAVSFRVTQVVDVNKGVHAMVAKDLFAPELRSVDPLGARAAPVPAPAQRPGG